MELEKIFDIKSSDNKKTLLQYVIEEVERQQKYDVVDPCDKMEDYEFLSKT